MESNVINVSDLLISYSIAENILHFCSAKDSINLALINKIAFQQLSPSIKLLHNKWDIIDSLIKWQDRDNISLDDSTSPHYLKPKGIRYRFVCANNQIFFNHSNYAGDNQSFILIHKVDSNEEVINLCSNFLIDIPKFFADDETRRQFLLVFIGIFHKTTGIRKKLMICLDVSDITKISITKHAKNKKSGRYQNVWAKLNIGFIRDYEPLPNCSRFYKPMPQKLFEWMRQFKIKIYEVVYFAQTSKNAYYLAISENFQKFLITINKGTTFINKLGDSDNCSFFEGVVMKDQYFCTIPLHNGLFVYDFINKKKIVVKGDYDFVQPISSDIILVRLNQLQTNSEIKYHYYLFSEFEIKKISLNDQNFSTDLISLETLTPINESYSIYRSKDKSVQKLYHDYTNI